MAVKNSGTTYNVGSVQKTQSQLNNNMSGTDANAIYYATHGGSGATNYTQGNTQASNPGSYVTYGNTGGNNSGSNISSGSKSGSSSGLQNGSLSGKSLQEVMASRVNSGGSESSGQAVSSGGGYDYMSMINEMLAKQRAVAEDAYNNSMGRLNDAWGNTQNALKNNLNSTLGNLQNQYDYSSKVSNDEAERSLREAYVNYMMNKKNLNQNLSAAGISGGATESSMAKMYNNYGNSRNDINTTLANNLASLLNNYQSNVASANNLYNTQFADAMNNYVNNMNGLESALAQNLAGYYSGNSLANLASFASNLASLQGSGPSTVEVTPITNGYSADSLSTTQANNTGTVTDYAKYLAAMQQMANNNSAVNNIVSNSNGLTRLLPISGLASR